MRYYVIIFFFFVGIYHGLHSSCKAIVIVPVADLVGERLQTTANQASSIENYYNTLNWSCVGTQYKANPRLHQLLFHEIVTVIKDEGQEVLVEVSNAYFTTEQSKEKHNQYWMKKSALLPINVSLKNIRLFLPIPVSFAQKTALRHHEATLIMPWYDTSINMHLSAGTRFVVHKKRDDGLTQLFRFNPTIKQVELIVVPSQLLICAHAQNSLQEKRAHFVSVLRLWASHTNGFIPYVLGGCSFTTRIHHNDFTKEYHVINNEKLDYYERPYHHTIKTGFDCSNLILRAAQIVGLPYHYKNSYTLAQNLIPLTSKRHVQEGDLIWMPGHVMIISNLKHNRIIEAHSYDGGYGRVHEKTLSETFKDIHTYAELEKAIHTKQRLQRLNAQKEVYKVYTKALLLSLC